MRNQADQARRTTGSLSAAGELLRELSRRLDGQLTWDTKRKLVEILVDWIKVKTVEDNERKTAEVTVKYRFTRAKDLTGMGSSPPRG